MFLMMNLMNLKVELFSFFLFCLENVGSNLFHFHSNSALLCASHAELRCNGLSNVTYEGYYIILFHSSYDAHERFGRHQIVLSREKDCLFMKNLFLVILDCQGFDSVPLDKFWCTTLRRLTRTPRLQHTSKSF